MFDKIIYNDAISFFFLNLKHIISININTTVETPDIMKTAPAPHFSATNPEKRFPNGADPANTRVYTLITLPLYSSLEFICNIVLAVVEKNILNIPVIAKLKAVK